MPIVMVNVRARVPEEERYDLLARERVVREEQDAIAQIDGAEPVNLPFQAACIIRVRCTSEDAVKKLRQIFGKKNVLDSGNTTFGGARAE